MSHDNRNFLLAEFLAIHQDIDPVVSGSIQPETRHIDRDEDPCISTVRIGDVSNIQWEVEEWLSVRINQAAGDMVFLLGVSLLELKLKADAERRVVDWHKRGDDIVEDPHHALAAAGKRSSVFAGLYQKDPHFFLTSL